MKKVCMSLITALVIVSAKLGYAVAGTDVGNGGGAWVCQNNDNLGTLRWVTLVDLYEGRTEFGFDIPNVANRDYLEIVDMVMVRKLFSIDEDLYKSVNSKLETVKSSLVSVDADLEVVDDALYRIRPAKKECLDGAISYVQLANYTTYGKILLQKNLFEDPRLGETDKAALMIHESVYAFLRDRYGDKDSVRARKIVGLLFSTLTSNGLKIEINKVFENYPPVSGNHGFSSRKTTSNPDRTVSISFPLFEHQGGKYAVLLGATVNGDKRVANMICRAFGLGASTSYESMLFPSHWDINTNFSVEIDPVSGVLLNTYYRTWGGAVNTSTGPVEGSENTAYYDSFRSVTCFSH